MKKYIAFLRGINVGNIRIKMPDLKIAFEKMDFKEVKTYLQTGNVVFESEKSISEIKVILEKGLTETFHYQAFVLLYDFAVLEEIVAKYPFQKDESNHAYVIFVESEIVFEELTTILENAKVVNPMEEVYIFNGTTESDFEELYKNIKAMGNLNIFQLQIKVLRRYE
jgi:uncharacterized protein (DUF1697 family)